MPTRIHYPPFRQVGFGLFDLKASCSLLCMKYQSVPVGIVICESDCVRVDSELSWNADYAAHWISQVGISAHVQSVALIPSPSIEEHRQVIIFLAFCSKSYISDKASSLVDSLKGLCTQIVTNTPFLEAVSKALPYRSLLQLLQANVLVAVLERSFGLSTTR